MVSALVDRGPLNDKEVRDLFLAAPSEEVNDLVEDEEDERLLSDALSSASAVLLSECAILRSSSLSRSPDIFF